MIQHAREHQPQGVYIIAYVNQMAALLKQLKAAGCIALKMGSGAVTEEVAALAGEAAEDLVYAQPKLDVESTEPKIAAFVKAFSQKYGQPPDVFAAHAYDALHCIAAAIKKGGWRTPTR